MEGWGGWWSVGANFEGSERFGATQNTINFDQQNLGNKKKWGSTKFHSLFLGFCLAGAQLLGKWPCFAQIADSLKHQPVAVYKKTGERHGKSSKFHQGGDFFLCGKIDSQRMEIRRLQKFLKTATLDILDLVSNIFSQNGGEKWWFSMATSVKDHQLKQIPGAHVTKGVRWTWQQ